MIRVPGILGKRDAGGALGLGIESLGWMGGGMMGMNQVRPPDTLGEAFRRGIRLHCPLCGVGKLFSGLVRMEQECGCCGFRYERGPGYFLGSTYINYGLTTLLTTWTYIVSRFVLGIEQRWLIPALVGFCLVFPVLFFRYARSLWLSLDCYFDREGAMEGLAEEGQEGVKKTF